MKLHPGDLVRVQMFTGIYVPSDQDTPGSFPASTWSARVGMVEPRHVALVIAVSKFPKGWKPCITVLARHVVGFVTVASLERL